MRLTERKILLIAAIIIAIIAATLTIKLIIEPTFQEINKSLQMITQNKN